MLPKKNRISRKEFPAHNKQGFRVFSPLFSAVFYKYVQRTGVSVVVSKKIAKTAVERNHLRRVFYTATQDLIKTLPHHVFMVFYPKNEAKTASFFEIQSEIVKALQKIR